MADGHLPALAQMRERSARFLLEHGPALRTGLGAEHISSGMSPDDAGRWSSLRFDKTNYEIVQEGPQFDPFPSAMSARTVAFDLPYFDLLRAPNVNGISAWGAHDAGTEFSSNPKELGIELLKQFGPYPASNSMYALAWPSPEKCKVVGEELSRGVELRSEIAHWLLRERFPKWDLALIGVSEAHSALEALWHGYDTRHPLHHHPSASAAGNSILNVYKAIDRLVGNLALAFEDATIVVFSMHGMGPNKSDVGSMALLPELLHRYEFGKPFFQQPSDWRNSVGGIPILGESESWDAEKPPFRKIDASIRAIIRPLIPKSVKDYIRSVLRNGKDAQTPRKRSVQWIPATRLQALWPKMHAFALPSYYDGRIRINLEGRENDGLVPMGKYEALCDEIASMLSECRDPVSKEPVVDFIERTNRDQPITLDPTAADMTVVWKGVPLAFEHPSLGKIGPIPFRRTGGHTGPFGMAYIASDRLAPGDYGVRSSFDVVPTLFSLLDEKVPRNISGHSMLAS